MINLIQFPWSPFCIVQRRILEYSGIRFKVTNIPSTDRSLLWRLSKQRYYEVPLLRDGRNTVFEMDESSQVIGKYLDDRLQLGLFPREWEGVQSILWRYIENEIEGVGFKLNDVYWQEIVPVRERLAFLRHKERRFGRGCLEQWQAQSKELLETLEARLLPFEEMLVDKACLLEDRPRFVDFDLFGMLGNFLYSGHYSLPAAHTRLKAWYERMKSLKLSLSAREKLHT
jgi:glutathione S-transferase